MTQQQQGDVLLYQTDDGGEINVVNGLVEMSGGLQTSVYLSLFGGNEDDDGRQDSAQTWWGNLSETEKPKRYRSEAQHLLQALPASSGNLRRIEDAAARDLQWFIDGGIASNVAVAASIPGLNYINLTIDIEAYGEESRFNYVENWKARS
ncbi:MAG: hypothetical protein GY811_04525 [Myxococcales bacterium]|nr:hypothetical protein [Myxococcales bacterium]